MAKKCTFCAHKLDQAVADGKVDRIGKDQAYTPSCDIVCPTQARMFGDIGHPTSDADARIATLMQDSVAEIALDV